MPYHHKKIEAKWRKKWESANLYATPTDVSPENKYYILPQLPYPSGSGLHVGHAEVYSACDIYARFNRMKGKDVFQAMGWDAFGLPAENYAIKTNIHPRINTDKAIDNFREQIKSMGVSVDWAKEAGSHNPDYYHWTQWFFLLMYKNGLAYRKNQSVNWCDSCKTVLANEQVVDGHCERCDTEVVQKQMEQWYLKITEYADRLHRDLETVDWPAESVKRQQDWIGPSNGAQVHFQLITGGKELGETLDVFTTRPDTLFGATFMVIAPEHPLISKYQKQIENFSQIEDYIKQASLKTELERQVDQEKTGVEIEGVKAVNPANGKQLPIFVADYVLMSYGTGAIMAVPAHDERDYDFAKKYNLDVVPVVRQTFGEQHEDSEVRPSVLAVIKHAKNDKFLHVKWDKFDWIAPVIGGIDKGETPEEAILREVAEETGYKAKIVEKLGEEVEVNYYAENKDVWRTRVDHIFLLEINEEPQVKATETDRHEVLWLTAEQAKQQVTHQYNNIGLLRYLGEEPQVFTEAGKVINSDKYDGLTTAEAKERITADLAEKGVAKPQQTFRLHDWSVSRQRFWGAPIPMLMKELEQDGFNALVLHGTGGSSESNWFPWIKSELEKHGVEVAVPDLPNSEAPEYEERMKFFEENYKEFLTENSVIIGHSSGAPAALHLASKYKVRKLILVAPVMYVDEDYHKVLEGFFGADGAAALEKYSNNQIDHEQVKQNVPEICFFFSDNDPYLPYDFPAYAREHYPDAVIKMFSGYGHFSKGTSGMTEFPEMLDFLPTSNVVMKPIPETDLPVLLPDDVDFKPTGQSPLTYSEKFQEGVEQKYGKGWKREVDTLDTFMCSSWYYYRYLAPNNAKDFADNTKQVRMPYVKPNDKTNQVLAELASVCDILEQHNVIPLVYGSIAASVLNRHPVIQHKDIDLIVYNPDRDASTLALETLKAHGYTFKSEQDFENEDGSVDKLFTVSKDGVDIEFGNSCMTPHAFGADDLRRSRMGRLNGRDYRVLPLDTLHKLWIKNEKTELVKFIEEYMEHDTAKWMPVDFYIGGPEHVTGHLLYSRFFTKVLFDAGYIDFDEPFLFHRHQGLILGEDNRKMSKRWGNVINPTDVVEKYGADTLRMYEMFMGPLEQAKAWNDKAASGVRKFIARVARFSESKAWRGEQDTSDLLPATHKLIKKVTNDTLELKYNTAISEFMKYLNAVESGENKVRNADWEAFLKLLAPYAPFVTEEAWEMLGHKDSIHLQTWPQWDEDQTQDEMMVIAIQINGKVRAEVTLPADSDEKQVISAAMGQENVMKWVEGKEIKKQIYVPGRILNLVVVQ